MFLSKKRKEYYEIRITNALYFEKRNSITSLITLLANCEENNKMCIEDRKIKKNRQSRIYLQLMNISIYFFFWSFIKLRYWIFVVYICQFQFNKFQLYIYFWIDFFLIGKNQLFLVCLKISYLGLESILTDKSF